MANQDERRRLEAELRTWWQNSEERYSVHKNPKEQWIPIPAPDAGLSREVLDAAREMIKDNRRETHKGRRFFELGGILYCGGCGKKMLYSAGPAKGRLYSYYKCRCVIRDGRDACSAGTAPVHHRVEELERRIWELVSDLTKSPERLREDLERMIELEHEGMRGDPEREAKVWLEKLAGVEQERCGYLRLAAKGHMTEKDLQRELAGLEETCKATERELALAKNRQERIELLERNKDEILNYYARLTPEALDELSPEERYRLYRMLRLKVLIHPDRSLEVNRVLVTGSVQSGFMQPEMVLR